MLLESIFPLLNCQTSYMWYCTYIMQLSQIGKKMQVITTTLFNGAGTHYRILLPGRNPFQWWSYERAWCDALYISAGVRILFIRRTVFRCVARITADWFPWRTRTLIRIYFRFFRVHVPQYRDEFVEASHPILAPRLWGDLFKSTHKYLARNKRIQLCKKI